MAGQMDRLIDRQMNEWIDRQTNIYYIHIVYIDIQIERQIDKKPRQREKYGQKDRKNRQIDYYKTPGKKHILKVC